MKTKSLLFTLIFCWATHLGANGIGIIDGTEGVYLTLVETNIDVSVNNQIATIVSRLTFHNPHGSSRVKYGIPIAESANPIALRWRVDGQWHYAEVGAQEQDNTLPGTGGNDTADPAIAAFLGDYVVFFSPESELEQDSLITIELTYVELLSYAFGKVSFSMRNDLGALQTTPLEAQSFRFSLESSRVINQLLLLDLAATYDVQPQAASVEFLATNSLANFNYSVEYELASDGLGVIGLSTSIPDTLFQCDEYGNGYLTVIIEPESNVNTEVVEKNFVFVIDRSGSMSGGKMTQARDAASFIVNNLNVGDNFNIVDFSSDIRSLFSTLQPVNMTNQDQALQYIDGLSANGSTNISGSLSYAINLFQAVDPNKANIILFFTDGQATTGTTSTTGILDIVRNAVNTTETGIFLFTFGIGSGANQQLLTRLALENNGLANFVEPLNLEEEITRFFLTINNPVLLNTTITFDPPLVQAIYPQRIPNLYKGQQLILSGRYDVPGEVNMHLAGQAFNLPVEYDFTIQLADINDPNRSVLPKIWAKQKIDDLGIAFNLAESSALQALIEAEIDSTSLCYGVVSTEFTSFEDNGGGPVETDDVVVAPVSFQVSAMPTLFRHQLTVRIQRPASLPADAVLLELYDMSGRKIVTTQTQLHGALWEYVWTDLSRLPVGMYLLKVRIGAEMAILKVEKG